MAVNTEDEDNKGKQQPAQPSTVMGDALLRAGVNRDAAASTPETEVPPAETAAPAVQIQPQQTHTYQEAPKMSQTPNQAPLATSLNTILSRPMSRRPAGEKVQGYVKTFNKIADESMDAGARKGLVMEILDSSNDQVLMNTVLVTMFVPKPNGGGTAAGVFELIVDDPTQRLPDLNLPTPQGPVTIRRTTADVADNELWEKARTAISARQGIPAANIYFAGSMTLPDDLAADDVLAMRNVLYTATQAIATVLYDEVLGQQEPLSIPPIVATANLQVSLNYADGDTVTATGLPVRSNLSIVMSSSDKQQASQSGVQSVHRKKVELTRVDGYIEPVYNPPAPPAYGQMPKTQSFNPRYVITRLDTQFDAITLEGQMFGLASAFTAGYNWAWAGVFLPRFASSAMRSNAGKKGNVELRDLGALGLMIPLEADGTLKRTSILSTKTEDKDLQQLITYAFNPEILFTLHVSETGDLAWMQEVFLAAAQGNEIAYKRIIDACDRLTNGVFGQKWQVRNPQTGQINPICFSDKIRIPLGYYTDTNTGQKHDLREIDLLAVANAVGDKDGTILTRWQNAMDNVNMPTDKRTEELLKILDDIIGVGRYTLTDYAVPVTFTGLFLQTLNESCVAAGADIRPTSLAVDFSGQAGRAVYGNLAAAAISPQQLNPLFNARSAVGGGAGFNSQIQTRY